MADRTPSLQTIINQQTSDLQWTEGKLTAANKTIARQREEIKARESTIEARERAIEAKEHANAHQLTTIEHQARQLGVLQGELELARRTIVEQAAVLKDQSQTIAELSWERDMAHERLTTAIKAGIKGAETKKL